MLERARSVKQVRSLQEKKIHKRRMNIRQSYSEPLLASSQVPSLVPGPGRQIG